MTAHNGVSQVGAWRRKEASGERQVGAGHSVMIPLHIPSSSVAVTLCLASPSRKIAAVALALPGDKASVTSAHSFSVSAGSVWYSPPNA